ncbi:hypothetical protein D3C86_1216320 [compost metagenome]
MAGQPANARQPTLGRCSAAQLPAGHRGHQQGRTADRGAEHQSPRRVALCPGCRSQLPRRALGGDLCQSVQRRDPGHRAGVQLPRLYPRPARLVAGAVHQWLQLGLVPGVVSRLAIAGVANYRFGGLQTLLERLLPPDPAHSPRRADFLGRLSPLERHLVDLVHRGDFHHRHLVPDPGIAVR